MTWSSDDDSGPMIRAELREAELKQEIVSIRRALAAEQAAREQAERERGEAQARDIIDAQTTLRTEVARLRRERDEARAAIAAIVEMVTHDVERITSWRQSRTSGGQHVGTGGVLGSATPSVLGYLRRLARDAEGYGAPLLAERDALRAEVERLRAVRDAAEPVACCTRYTVAKCYVRAVLSYPNWCAGCRLRAALDAAKEGA